MARSLYLPTSSSLLAALIEAPDLVRTIRALPAPRFSALVRHLGVEDAGEIIALATRDQIVTAFDEDLFANHAPGERETFDVGRFVVWLEVLLEAGDEVAAERMAELSEDFLAHAISSMLWVFDVDALAVRMSQGGRAADSVDRALETSLSEELDGYLLVAKRHDGWDAALALVLALDRDRRDLLVRLLDHCAAVGSDYVEDLDALADVLNAEESLAEDVEAEREDRRARQGYVEPRAARNFLALARKPLAKNTASEDRDPVTRAYFRELEPAPAPAAHREQGAKLEQLAVVAELTAEGDAFAIEPVPGASDSLDTFMEAMRTLHVDDPASFGARMEELAYLSNVLVAGASLEGERLSTPEAAEAALVTVAFGATLEALQRREARHRHDVVRAAELVDVLRDYRADRLFRRASSTLVRGSRAHRGFFHTREELGAALEVD